MKTFVMLAIGLGALRLMRHRSASSRHWMLAVAIACAAGLPLLQPVAPSWRWQPRAEQQTSPPGPTAAGMGLPTTIAEVEIAGTPAPKGPSAAPALMPRVLAWLTAVQWAGATFFLLVLAVGLLRLEWFAARARPVSSARVTAAARSIEQTLGITRPVRLLRSAQISLPMTWGIARPVVLLPSDVEAWSDARLHTVLGHELAHVHRGDWVALMLAELFRAVNWLNPLTWLAARRLRFESELACDDMVLGMGASPPEYAAHLLALVRVARIHQTRPIAAASSMARPSGFERRVEAMLNARLERLPATRRARGLIAAPLLATALLLAGYGSAAQSLASLSGSVFDPQNLGIPRATITLTDPRTEARREVRSDPTGRFEFVGLPPGDYRLETTVPGFESAALNVSVLNRHVEQDVTLRLGSLRETVTLSYSSTPETPREAPRPAQSVAAPPSAACAASASGGNIKPPMKVRNVNPVYPANGQAEGTVLLDTRIGPDGVVISAIPREPGNADLAQAAVAAVMQWRFTPTLLNCVPVEVGMSVTVRFSRQ
jgi:TonB family protein